MVSMYIGIGVLGMMAALIAGSYYTGRTKERELQVEKAVEEIKKAKKDDEEITADVAVLDRGDLINELCDPDTK